MAETQTATLFFLGPVAAAYLAACGAWWVLFAWRQPSGWPAPRDFACERPWLELGLALLVAVAVLAVGRMYDADWLLPRRPGVLGWVIYDVNMLIVFAPLFVYLAWRGQPLSSIWCEARGLPVKLGFGMLAAAIAVAIYLALRGELSRFGSIASASVQAPAVAHFLPVFLEGVGLAFLFVRLQGALGRSAAIAIPCLLFAVAHVPGALADGRAWGHIAVFFVFNTALPGAILFVVARSRDVIWLAIVHYFMDVAIRAF
jgi:hypothetical protein